MTRRINYNSRAVIRAGFAITMVLLLALAALSVHDFLVNDTNLSSAGGDLSEVKHVFEMRDVVHQRVLLLYRMLEISDPNVRNALYDRFRSLADVYNDARNRLMQKEIDGSQVEIYRKLESYIRRNREVQNQVAELIQGDRIKKARALMVREAIPAQDKAMNLLTRLFDLEHRSAESGLNKVRNTNWISLIAISLLAGVSIIIGALVSVVVARRIHRTEDVLLTQSDRIWRLYRLSANPRLTVGEQITATLELGCQMFDMEVGKVCAVDTQARTNTFLHVVAPEDMGVRAGTVLDLDLTFSGIVYEENESIAIPYVAHSPYKNAACYDFLRFESCIAAPIFVNGQRYGTINFSSRNPRHVPFSKADKDLMSLMGGWVSVAIERELIKEDMRRAKEAAESASRAKSHFLANMSHEIRTPLTAILGYSESLMDSFQTSEERERAVQAILRSGGHLQQIINDILDLSKIEAQQLEIESLEVPLFQLLADIDLVAGARAREKGLSFNVEYQYPVPSKITTDPTRLKQILINLCSNAVKFTESGTVTINVSYLPDSQQMQFVVSDTGIGIAPEEMKRLFVAFSQADVSTTRKYGGTGLGLCISQQLANKLGGQIVCDSAVNQGSRFTLTIDAGTRAGEHLVHQADRVNYRQTQNHTHRQNSFSGRILLAEDSVDNQRLITMYIRRTGAEVMVADNGRVAVEQALSHEFDLILMDMQMPIMGGLEATKRLRKAGCTTPVVALTANAMKSDRDKYLEAGAEDYLTKPLDLDNFFDVITRYLKPRQETTAAEGARHPVAQETVTDSGADLRSQYAHDEDYKELIQDFVAMLPDIVGEIASAAQRHDWETLQMVSHRLKGSGGSYGFPRLTELAKKINDDVRAAYFDHIAEAVADLNALTQAIIGAHDERKVS